MNSNQQELQQTLAQLKDAHIPIEALWWPPSPAVLVLVITASLLCIYTAYQAIQYIKALYQQRTKTRVINELEKIQNSINAHTSNDIVTNTNIILKKCVQIKFPKGNEASLTGKSWLKFLDQTGNTDYFSKNCTNLLNLQYMPKNIDKKHSSTIKKQINEYIAAAKKWVKYNL